MCKRKDWAKKYLQELLSNWENKLPIATPLQFNENEATLLSQFNEDLYLQTWFLFKRAENNAQDLKKSIEMTIQCMCN